MFLTTNKRAFKIVNFAITRAGFPFVFLPCRCSCCRSNEAMQRRSLRARNLKADVAAEAHLFDAISNLRESDSSINRSY